MHSPAALRLPVLQDLPLELERDIFLRSLIRELSGTLEDVIGLEEAAGFISVVGQRIGEQINTEYRRSLGLERLDRATTGAVLVDLKRRIRGDFFVIEESDTHLVLGNRRCPFGDKVVGRRSLCMMTSNVFGVIAAENQGYAHVLVEEAIARGDPGCRIVIQWAPTTSAHPEGREYFAALPPSP